MNRLVAPVSKTGTPSIFAETSAWSASRRSVRELSAGRINLSCPKEPATGTQACSPCCTPTWSRRMRHWSARARARRDPRYAPAGTQELRSRAIRRQETRSGQGALARRHTDGPLRAALLKATLRCGGLDPTALSCSFACSEKLRLFESPKTNSDPDSGTGPTPPVTVLRVKPIAGAYSREHCPRVYAICRPELG